MNEQEKRHSKYIDQARIESARLEDKVQELTTKLEKAEKEVLNDDMITRHVNTLTTQKAAADLENTNLKMQVEELTSKLKAAEKKAVDDAAELELFKTYLQSARKSIMKYKLPSKSVNDDSSSEEEYMMFEKHKAKNKDASNSEDKVRVATPAMYFKCIHVHTQTKLIHSSNLRNGIRN